MRSRYRNCFFRYRRNYYWLWAEKSQKYDKSFLLWMIMWTNETKNQKRICMKQCQFYITWQHDKYYHLNDFCIHWTRFDIVVTALNRLLIIYNYSSIQRQLCNVCTTTINPLVRNEWRILYTCTELRLFTFVGVVVIYWVFCTRAGALLRVHVYTIYRIIKTYW